MSQLQLESNSKLDDHFQNYLAMGKLKLESIANYNNTPMDNLSLLIYIHSFHTKMKALLYICLKLLPVFKYTPMQALTVQLQLTAHTWQNCKRVFLIFYCCEIHRVEAVGLEKNITITLEKLRYF